MARDGSGNYSNPYPDFVSGTVINSTQVDDNNAAIATALTQSIAVDGQTTITANLPMSNFKHTGVAAGVALTEYADVKSVQNATYIDCGTAGGTANALTLSPSPAITAYVAGQVFRFKAGASPSSSAATVAVSGLTATAIQLDGAALSATVVIEAGKHYSVKYDGTVFQATRESLAWPLPIANGGTGATSIPDDDTFAAASATTLASSESIKTYVDAKVYAGVWVEIATYPVTVAAASIDITDLDNTVYDAYEIIIDEMIPVNDGVGLYIRTNNDGTATFDAGASDYSWGGIGWRNGLGATGYNANNAQMQPTLAVGVGNAAGEQWQGRITCNNPARSAEITNFEWMGIWFDGSTNGMYGFGTGARLADGEVQAVQLLFSAGNIATANVRLRGRVA
jgi:hypothetical protein